MADEKLKTTDISDFLKCSSVHWSTLGMVFSFCSDWINQLWSQLPNEIVNQIPHSNTITGVIFLLALVGRYFSATKVTDDAPTKV